MSAPPEHAYSRLPSLTGLRAIAAFLVLANHGVYLFVFADQGVQDGYRFVGDYLGSIGVCFFFVLSGFVLTWSAGRSVAARRFWRSRLVKIFPNHLVVFAVAVALLLASAAPFQVPEAVANLFLVHGFVPSQSYTLFAVNGVTWSLSAELLFYALFPLLFLLVRRVRPERLWFWAAGAVAFALVLPLIAMALLPDTPVSPLAVGMSWPQMWFLYFFPGARLVEFVIGMFLARLVQTGRWIGPGVIPAAVLVVGAYIGSLYAPTPYRSAAVYVVPLALLIGAVARSDTKGRPSVLRSRLMIFLGEISFALFVVHLVLMQTVRAAVEGTWAGYGGYPVQGWSTPVGILFLLGEVAVSVLAAWLLHRFVEMPAMRRWSRGSSLRPAPAAPAERVPVAAGDVRTEPEPADGDLRQAS
jgi:peptidoglycan/LPS O-acetylase OafA/YrhL